MGVEGPAYAVVVATADQINIPAIGQALAAYKKIPITDATHDARVCWGVIAENLSEAEAEKLIGYLKESKVPAVRLDQSRLNPLPQKIELLHSEWTEQGLQGTDVTRQTHRILWPDISVISAAGISTTTSKTVTEKQGPTNTQKALSIGLTLATGGIPINLGPKKKTIVKKVSATELNFFLTLVSAVPPFHVRVYADGINFSHLKDRKLYNVMGNFKIFLADIVSRAPQAQKSKGTRILLANQAVNTMGYESEADVEREVMWLRALL